MSDQTTNCKDNKLSKLDGQLLNEDEEHTKCVECFKLILKESLKTGCVTSNMLQFAASHGLLDECKLLVANGLDVNEINEFGWTPVMQAVRNGHYLVSKTFIECGGSVDICNSYGINAIALAALSKNLCLLQLVSEASMNQDIRNNSLKLALELSCLYGFTDIVQWVVSSTILNLNEPSSLSDLTPLMLAVTEGHVDIVKLLLDHGADPSIQNSTQRSAIYIACYKNNSQIKSLLYRKQLLQPSSPFLLSSPISPNRSSHFVFPSIDKFSMFVLPNNITKKHSTLVPLSPFVQAPQFTYNVSPCYCTELCHTTSVNLPSTAKSAQESHSSGSWYSSSWDSYTGYSDAAALVSPRLMQKYSKLHSQTSGMEFSSPQKGKKRKLFDKQWCSSWIKRLGKKRIKPLDDSSEQTLVTELPVRTSNFFNFSQLLFNLELEEYWPIFKEHENTREVMSFYEAWSFMKLKVVHPFELNLLDIGIFLTLTAEDLDIMGIKDKQSQTMIINKIENLKRTQL